MKVRCKWQTYRLLWSVSQFLTNAKLPIIWGSPGLEIFFKIHSSHMTSAINFLLVLRWFCSSYIKLPQNIFKPTIWPNTCKIKHLLSQLLCLNAVIKTFQNLLPFSPAKVCLLFLFGSLLNVFSLSPPPCFVCLKNKHMSGFTQYYRTGCKLSENTLLIIDYSVWYTICLVLVVGIAMDNRSSCIRLTDFNELITMFPDKINPIPLCKWLFPVSTVQTINS